MNAEAAKWTTLMTVESLPIGQQRFIVAGVRELAVFRIGQDEFTVTDNACPHAGANLAAGRVENGAVVCPWHEWTFDLRSGQCVHNERVCIRKYSVRVRDGQLEAALENPSDPE